MNERPNAKPILLMSSPFSGVAFVNEIHCCNLTSAIHSNTIIKRLPLITGEFCKNGEYYTTFYIHISRLFMRRACAVSITSIFLCPSQIRSIPTFRSLSSISVHVQIMRIDVKKMYRILLETSK